MKAAEVSDQELAQMVTSQHKGDFYADLLSRQDLDSVIFEDLESPYFKKVQLYLCTMTRPGLNEHDFVFFVDERGGRSSIVTESVAGLQALLKSESDFDIASVDPAQFAQYLLTLQRPRYRRFEVLHDDPSRTIAAEGSVEVELGQGVTAQYSREHGLTATVIARDGRDLVVKTLNVGPTLTVATKDLVRVKGIFSASSPHD